VNAVVYSTPRLLGTLTVDASGRVSGTLTIPSDLAAGDHTIQLQGTGADGQPRVLQSPLTVSAPKSKIPLTGTDARTTALYGLLILAVGLLVRGRQLAGG
jgi:hypothetical protein